MSVSRKSDMEIQEHIILSIYVSAHTMQTRLSPRPFLNFSLVVEACAMILPPIGLVLSFAKLIPSGFATTLKTYVDYEVTTYC